MRSCLDINLSSRLSGELPPRCMVRDGKEIVQNAKRPAPRLVTAIRPVDRRLISQLFPVWK
jgi:hypothetical protein